MDDLSPLTSSPPQNPQSAIRNPQSAVTWLVYGVYLFARLVAGWRGTRLNYLLIVGLAVTLTLYFIPSTAHRFS